MPKIIIQSVLIALCLIVVSRAFGWVNPSAAPYGGAGVISFSSSGVGVGVPNPAYPLDVSGNVQWSGTLTSGDVPWSRLDSYPAGCSAGRLVTTLGLIPTCANPSWTGLINIPAPFADNIDDVGTGITSISAGTGITLSPNPITGVGSVAIDAAYAQRRVTGSCGATGSVRVINADGTVICQTF